MAFQNNGTTAVTTNNYLRAPNSPVGVGSLGLGGNTDGGGQNQNASMRNQWILVPVSPVLNKNTEVGWYYIENAYAAGYGLLAPTNTGDDITLANNLATAGDRDKWRLVPIRCGTTCHIAPCMTITGILSAGLSTQIIRTISWRLTDSTN